MAEDQNKEETKKEEKAEETAPAAEEAAPAKEEAAKEEVKEEPKAEEPAPAKEEPAKEVEVPKKFQAIVSAIDELTVLELNELIKVFEEKYGVSASAMMAAAPAAGGDGGDDDGGGAVNVELTAAGGQKIQVIKVVKEVLGLGLKEAKDLVDGAPEMLKEGVPKEEAEEIKKKVEEAGGTVSFK